MSSNVRPLTHMPFFEQLSELAADSAEWRSLSAALVVMRLFDDWMTDGASVVAEDAAGLRAVRDQVANAGIHDSTAALMSSIVEAMVTAEHPRIATVAPRLMAYARALQQSSRWILAADVYRTVLSFATPLVDAETFIGANMQLGRCLRVLAEWDEALSCYASASQVATITDDLMSVLRARIQEAHIAIDRGNLPHAESLLDETMARAKEAGLSEIGATATHDRGHLALRRGQPAAAVILQFEAFKGVRNQMARDRVLNDLGASFAQLGVYTAARDAFLVVAATAQEQYLRWTATINLLDLATFEHREPLFEQHRRTLEHIDLPPALSVYYFMYAARGYLAFEKLSLATSAINRAIEVATVHQLGQARFEAENLLEDIRREQAAENRQQRKIESAKTWSPEVDGVAKAMHELRTMAGVQE